LPIQAHGETFRHRRGERPVQGGAWPVRETRSDSGHPLFLSWTPRRRTRFREVWREDGGPEARRDSLVRCRASRPRHGRRTESIQRAWAQRRIPVTSERRAVGFKRKERTARGRAGRRQARASFFRPWGCPGPPGDYPFRPPPRIGLQRRPEPRNHAGLGLVCSQPGAAEGGLAVRGPVAGQRIAHVV